MYFLSFLIFSFCSSSFLCKCFLPSSCFLFSLICLFVTDSNLVHLATMFGHIWRRKLLLTKVNAKIFYFYCFVTPASCVSLIFFFHFFLFIIEYRSTSTKDWKEGKTPLQWASSNEHHKLSRYLEWPPAVPPAPSPLTSFPPYRFYPPSPPLPSTPSFSLYI